MDGFENIKRIVDRVLGQPKRDYGGSGDWYEYNCPYCTDENMGVPDGKYNMAVQIGSDGLWGHCWKCDHTDKLYQLVKKFGSQTDVEDYKVEVNALKERNLYTLSQDFYNSDNSIFISEELKLPKNFKLITSRDFEVYYKLNKVNSSELSFDGIDYNDYEVIPPLEYLIYERRIYRDFIEKFKIGYLKDEYNHRIVIPSYDEYGDLNYWVARDYTGKSKTKILNPDVDKKSIIFNEYNLNWYEPITIVEGPFDHIVVPNSIPLLGKTLDEECYAFKKLVEKAHSYINIMLDSDARGNAIKLYCFLEKYFPGRVKIISIPYPYDPADYHYHYGRLGIIELLNSGKEIDKNVINMALLGNEERKKHCKSSKQKNSVYNAIDMLS